MSAVLDHDREWVPPRQGDHRALRFLTAGSVDDGKSTLIGRLLLDSRRSSPTSSTRCERRAAGAADRPVAAHRRPGGRARTGHHDRRGLPLLRHPAAQVHHRRRARPRAVHAQHGHGSGRQRRRRGAGRHHQARHRRAAAVELLPQTRRHALLAHLLRVPSIVFAVNKLDARRRPQRCVRRRARRAAALRRTRPASTSAGIVPVSALRGDNVTHAARLAPWYRGPTLLQLLESAAGQRQEQHDGALRLPVQYVARDGDGVGHQARVALGPHRAAAGACGRRGAVAARAASKRRVCRHVLRAGQVGAVARGRRVGRPRARPPARRLARRLDRRTGPLHDSRSLRGHARLARHRAGARRPQVLGAPRQPLGAGAHRRHRAPARHPHAAADTDAHQLARQRHRPRSRSNCSSRCRSSRYADNRVGGALIVVDPASNRTSGALLVREAAR